jgi:GNAT superfamily N-acetyltransferase
MSAILTDFSPEAVIPAMEENLYRVMQGYLASIPGAEYDEQPERIRYRSGVPYFLLNGVKRARLTEANADAVIAEMGNYFQAHALPMSWMITPDSRPADLGARLEANGMAHGAGMPGMALDLALLTEPAPTPEGVSIRMVQTGEELALWMQALALGYDIPGEVGEIFLERMAGTGYAAYPGLHNFVAMRKGEPLACSSIFLGAGVAGLYCVATIPAARRQGIGTAIVRAPLDFARAAGYCIAVLQASAMGEPIYRRMGFRAYCTFDLYVAAPDADVHPA